MAIYQSPYNKAKLVLGGLAAKALISQQYPTVSRRFVKRPQAHPSETETKMKKRKVGRSTTFKDKMLKQVEAKHWTNNTLNSMSHQTLYVHNPTYNVVQGTSINTRVGDKIYLSAIKFKGSFQAPATSGAYTFRIIIGYSGEEFPTGTTFTSGGILDTEIFHPSTSNNWTTNGVINPKAFTMLYDERIDLNSFTTDTAEVRSLSTTVQLDKDFPYQSGGSRFGKFKNLTIVITSNVAGGSAGVSPSGTWVMGYDLIYKDL